MWSSNSNIGRLLHVSVEVELQPKCYTRVVIFISVCLFSYKLRVNNEVANVFIRYNVKIRKYKEIFCSKLQKKSISFMKQGHEA